MLFAMIFIISVITYVNVPVSLLPDIDIPETTIRISGQNISARELESTTVRPVRQQLLQIAHLRNIRTETRDGNAIIYISFDYGTNIDLAFIEVNEKIDASMNSIPKEIDRPTVVKASATDIPVLNIYLTLKDYSADKFAELSDFAENVIRRRIEQLPQVALADVSGLVKPQVVITPDEQLLDAGVFSLSDIEKALENNNYTPGSMTVRDGYYEYTIRFSTALTTVDDICNIYINKSGRIYQLKDLARIEQTFEKEKGMTMYNGKRAIELSIIKQSEENMANMQASLGSLVEQLRRDYPEVDFNVTQNQTELLDYTISNLQQNLLLAFVFVCLVSFFFLRDIKSPLIIGLSMFISLIISLLFFYLFHISLNVVSLTGLILALGMMIDNSIIVTDNIGQYRSVTDLSDACIKGTNEVIAPMLSSVMTTISIFVPLIFISGIAGAIFFDQAFSVTAGLLVSYLTGIFLLPVLYKMIYSAKTPKWLKFTGIHKRQELTTEEIRNSAVFRLYDRGINFVFTHKTLVVVIMLLVFPAGYYLFKLIPKEKMPDLNQSEIVASLDWNENIHVWENYERCRNLTAAMDNISAETSGLIGQQQFMLNSQREQTSSESEIYFRTASSDKIPALEAQIREYLAANYPRAVISFAPAGTVFEKIFATGEADFITEYYAKDKTKEINEFKIREMERDLIALVGKAPEKTAFQSQLNLSIDKEKLLLYGISYDEVYRRLQTAFKENKFATLRSQQQYLPIVLGGDVKSVRDVIDNTTIDGYVERDSDGNIIVANKLPLSAFVKVVTSNDLKTITSGKSDEYIPFYFYGLDDIPAKMDKIVSDAKAKDIFDVKFSGSFFSNKQMLNELIVILIISILLMYFILAAQFENFAQPLIVLLEIPIDVAAALALLYITGNTLNLMSAIGIIVTCGIIINDSILKVDVMNQLRKEGLPLMEAIHEAGRRRLKAILMTSLTSIVCLAPLFFSTDLGSELEKPLAVATIGGMVIGTPVSLFVVPLVYWWIYRKHEQA
jgi:multidrug efflux pump subunit AcrB